MLVRLSVMSEGPGVDWERSAFSDRLEHALGHETAYAFAKRIGMNDSTFRTYLSGKEPKRDTLVVFSEALNVLLEWLAAGRGPMRPGQVAQVASHDEATTGDLVAVPFGMASASAGPGLIPVNEGEDSIWVSESFLRRYGLYPRTTYALKVEGDSMVNKDGYGIPPGSLAFIDTAIGEEDVITGCIYVLTRESELLIKRVERHIDRTITLHSDNPRYRPEHVPVDVMLTLHIVGRLKVSVLEY